MTVETFPLVHPHVISGTGPYAVPFPYETGAVVAVVLHGRERIVLGEGDFTVDPVQAAVNGTLTLSSGVAAARSGGRLVIARDTDIEQGWTGQGYREAGLERQLDWITMAVQELRAAQERMLRSDLVVAPVAPLADHVLVWDAGGRLDSFPRSEVGGVVHLPIHSRSVATGSPNYLHPIRVREPMPDLRLVAAYIDGERVELDRMGLHIFAVGNPDTDGWHLAFDPPAGSGAVIETWYTPPVSVEQAAAYVQAAAQSAQDASGSASAASGSAAAAAGYAAQAGAPFPSRATAEAAQVPAGVDFIAVQDLQYRRDPVGTALETGDGARWSPVGDTRPEHWGATGAEADASPIFQAMLDWIADKPDIRIVDRFTGTRTFLSGLTSTGHVQWNAGSATYLADHNDHFLQAHGNDDPVIVPLTSDYVAGSTTLHAVLPVVPTRGDWLRVVSNAVNPADRSRIGDSNKYRVQEFIQAGAGSTSTEVILSRPLRFVEGVNSDEDAVVAAYSLASNARICAFDESKIFRFEGGRVEFVSGLVSSTDALRVTGYFRPVVQNAIFHNIYGSAINYRGTVGGVIAHCVFGELADSENAPAQNGYGVCDGGENTLVDSCEFRKCRHGYTTLRNSLGNNSLNVFLGGNTVGGRVINCVSVGCTATHFDCHHGAFDVTFQGCHAEGGASGFGNRGIGIQILDCSAYLTAGAVSTLVEAQGLAGNLDRYTTQYIISGGKFQVLGDKFFFRNSRVAIRNTRVSGPSLRGLIVVNSIVILDGVVEIITEDLNGAVPLETPVSSFPVSVNPGSSFFGGTARLYVNAGAMLRVDVSGFASIPSSVLGPASGTSITVFGALKIAVPANASLMALAAARLITSPASLLEVALPADGLDLGTAAGKFIAYYDDGTAFP